MGLDIDREFCRRLRNVVTVALLVGVGLESPTLATPLGIDARNSTVMVYVDKQGMFSFLADNHMIEASIADGTYDSASETVEVSINAAALKVLDPKLTADKRTQVQAAMIGPKVLDVERYPTITFHSTHIEQLGRDLKIVGALSLHGRTHAVTVLAQQLDASHFSGSATIRQTDFGITPIKIAGGVVSVRDDVRIDFRVALSG